MPAGCALQPHQAEECDCRVEVAGGARQRALPKLAHRVHVARARRQQLHHGCSSGGEWWVGGAWVWA